MITAGKKISVSVNTQCSCLTNLIDTTVFYIKD